jgi:hypothetical protein
MALSTTLDKPGPVMIGGNVKFYTGSWSQTSGGAAGTLALRGSVVRGYQFLNLDGSGPSEANVFITTSASGGTVTLTIQAHDAVTTGSFWVATK